MLCPAAFHLPARADARPRHLRRPGRQAVRRAAGRRRAAVVRDGVRRTDHRAGRRRRRPHLRAVRGRLPLRARRRTAKRRCRRRIWTSRRSAARSPARSPTPSTTGTRTTATSPATNANAQGLEPPLRMRWARRLEGTVKHLPVCGGGRLYTHTAEGQIIAVEQDTGRLLWRRYWPDVYLSFTSPLYINGKLIVPQAGIKQSVMRCLDAATGKLLWEAPFTGSPSWSRQFPPVVHGNLAIYASGSGEYACQGTEKPFTFKGDAGASGGRPRGHGLDLLERQSVLSEGQPPAALGLGPRHRQGGVAEGLFGVRPRRQRLRHLPARTASCSTPRSSATRRASGRGAACRRRTTA